MMQKGMFLILVLILLLGFAGYSVAQRMPQNPCGGQPMMGQGQRGGPGAMGPGMGMMGQMGQGMGMMGQGMGMVEQGMGQMGPVIGSPEIMGAMMSFHAEIMSTMGQMMQKYGNAIGQASPELQQKMRKELMERMGEILTQHGASLKKRATAAVK